MKKFLFASILASFTVCQLASAQNSKIGSREQKISFQQTAIASAASQHAAMLDKIQQETEELILTVAPSPLVSLARFLDQKMTGMNKKKAMHKAKHTEESIDL